MSASGIGFPDILTRFRSTRVQSDLRSALDQASRELATGEREGLFNASSGAPDRLLALDRSIARVESRQPLIASAKSRAAATGAALDVISQSIEGLGIEALDPLATSPGSSSRRSVLDRFEGTLDHAIATLNTQSRGRYVFGGARVDEPPIDVEGLKALMSSFLEDEAPGLPDAEALGDSFDEFFKENWSSLHTHSEPAPSVELDDGRRLDYALNLDMPSETADPPPRDAPALRDLIRDLALGAWAEEIAEASGVDSGAVIAEAGSRLAALPDRLIETRARLGLDEQRMEEAETRLEAEKTALQIGRNEMVGVDPFETATRVLELQTRLEELYAVTARRANLSFTNYMR